MSSEQGTSARVGGSGTPTRGTSASGGERAYKGRLGKDRSVGESRHSRAPDSQIESGGIPVVGIS
jgi:hypothetical protein